ncbi:MAG: rhodanese-like domain-containing protein, partial [Candidatus Eremiobacterota bacterium]
LVAQPSRATVLEVHARLTGPEPPVVVDVRSPQEYRSGHLEGSRNIPLTELPRRWQEVPSDRPVVIHCQSGYRSGMAASLLAHHGLTCHTDMIGGIAAWQQAGLPLAR